MKQRMVWGALLVMMSISASAMASKIQVHGHRGARAVLPENTLPAFKYALEAGVDVLEMDLAVTKDNVLVISHDPVIDPELCIYKNGNKITSELLINYLTLEQIKQIDCGTLKNPKFPKQTPVPGTEIPTLDEVFQMVLKHPSEQAKKVLFNIETKIFLQKPNLTVDPEVFAKLFIQKVNQYGLLNRVIMQSFDYRTLVKARALEPNIVISALSEDPTEDLLLTAKRLKANFVSPYYKFLNPVLVSQLHAAGVKIVPWTVNEPVGWQSMIQMGVDAVITDDPKALIEYLEKN